MNNMKWEWDRKKLAQITSVLYNIKAPLQRYTCRNVERGIKIALKENSDARKECQKFGEKLWMSYYKVEVGYQAKIIRGNTAS